MQADKGSTRRSIYNATSALGKARGGYIESNRLIPWNVVRGAS